MTVLDFPSPGSVPPSERPQFIEGRMHSDRVLRGLTYASYILTGLICYLVYTKALTPWAFFAVFVVIWLVLAAVVMQRSSYQAEKEVTQKMLKLFGSQENLRKSLESLEKKASDAVGDLKGKRTIN